jgi:outer membrane protein TolC
MDSNERVSRFLTLTCFALTLIAYNAQGQHIIGSRSKNDSVPPQPTLYRNSNPTPRPVNSDSVVQERLVLLALSGPVYDVTGHQINVAENNLTKAKRSWLNLLSFSFDYNNLDLPQKASTAAQNNYVYPKYFFGVTIPIGLFFTMGPDVKTGRENVAIQRDNQLQMARTIRADVLAKYVQYKAYSNQIALQSNVVDDEEALRKQTEKKFQDGGISIEQYNLANKIYGEDMTKKLNLQLQQDLLRIDIEKMIGISLESVLKMR